MDNNIYIPEDSQILVASDYIQSIVEGQTDIVDGLVKIALRNDIVLMKAVICEGLEKTENSTADGLHGLGRLIAASSKFIIKSEDERVFELSNDKHRKISAVEHLKYLIQPNITIYTLIELWIRDFMPITSDEEIVDALLSVREGDILQISTFAKALNLIYVVRFDDISLEDRIKRTAISKEFAKQLRAKALQNKNQ